VGGPRVSNWVTGTDAIGTKLVEKVNLTLVLRSTVFVKAGRSRSSKDRLFRLRPCEGTSRGPYTTAELLFERSKFVGVLLNSTLKPNGFKRSPSPTENSSPPIMAATVSWLKSLRRFIWPPGMLTSALNSSLPSPASACMRFPIKHFCRKIQQS